MVKVIAYNKKTRKIERGGEELIERWQSDHNIMLWVDLHGVDPDVERSVMRDRFRLNELAIADALRDRHPPKFEAFDDYVFILLRGIKAESTEFEYIPIHLSIFFGQNFIITRHKDSSRSINRAWEDAVKGKLTFEGGTSHIAYQIGRNVVDRYTPILLNIEARIEVLEENMFGSHKDDLLEELISYNSNLKKLRRSLTYQKKVFNKLMNHEAKFIDQAHFHEFNDIYEHFDRLSSLSDLNQELAVDLINGYLSLSSHKLNKIMKVLTIVAVIFMPLGLLAGIYGMNFEVMPELRWRYGYFTVLGFMGVSVVLILSLLRKLKWL